ncbi:hypothetical protein [Hymenobacter antarcticus]|uniref:Uncharacterized protein n=1 Tax=Hymenobacter antarcticus TaxID=486270 RepID=A0ABP7P7T0_9BACT
MHILLKILITGLLVMLVLALGTEVVALRRGAMASGKHPAHPVVVRKVLNPAERLKTVRPVK